MPRNPYDDAQDQDPDAGKGGSGLGIAALVMGIPGLLFFPLGIAALVCGILGLKNRGKGMAIAGIVLGSMSLLVLPMAVIAAIAIPSLLESRVVANESVATSTLKSLIHPGQTMFQAGAHVDVDGDNKGEYGGLAQLAAAGCLDLSFATGGPIVGYRYVVWVPDGQGGAVRGSGTLTADSCTDAERYFIAYAWPESYGATGRRIFAVTQDGRVVQAPMDTQGEPAWDAALGPGDTTGERFRNLAWSQVQR